MSDFRSELVLPKLALRAYAREALGNFSLAHLS